jgi:hypothetical protein
VTPDKAPLAAEGPPPAPPPGEGDPFRALDDLMATIELFCRTWPQREAPRRPWRCVL